MRKLLDCVEHKLEGEKKRLKKVTNDFTLVFTSDRGKKKAKKNQKLSIPATLIITLVLADEPVLYFSFGMPQP